MKQRVLAYLGNLSPGSFWLVGLMVAAALVAEAWIVALRAPFDEYRSLVATRQALAAIEQMTQTQEQDLKRAAAQSRALAERLSSELQGGAQDEQVTVALMRGLDQAANRAGVTLTSLKPAGRRNVLAFEELAFDVGAHGGYLAVCQWLLDFERSIGRLATVSDFSMRSLDDGRRVSVSMKLALYRPRSAEVLAKAGQP